MVLEVDDFNVQMIFDHNKDTLELHTDRDLKNSDVLLILIHIIGLIDAEHRTDVLDLALSVVEQKALDEAN